MKVTRLTEKADRLLQETTRILYYGKCSWCRRTRDGAGHHLYGRARTDTRWYFALVPYLCQECHNKVHAEGQEAFLAYIRATLPALWTLYESKKKERRIHAWELDAYTESCMEKMRNIQAMLAAGGRSE